MKTQRILSATLLFSFFLILCCYYIVTNGIEGEVTTTILMKSYESQSESDKALINTYINRIEHESNSFYREYYTSSPILNNYSVTVKCVTSDKRTSLITFKTLPYLGPHNTIGVDEITFSADYKGNIKLAKYDHLISYHLPENLRNMELKLVPGKYAD